MLSSLISSVFPFYWHKTNWNSLYEDDVDTFYQNLLHRTAGAGQIAQCVARTKRLFVQISSPALGFKVKGREWSSLG